MSDVPPPGDGPRLSDADIFHQYFPSGRIERAYELPTIVSNQINVQIEKAKRQILETNKISHNDGSTTYTARYAKDKTEDGSEFGSETTELIDIDTDDQIVGIGFIYSSNPQYVNGEPFVGYNNTFTDFQKQGLGKRRLIVMNALAQMHYHLPLHSSTKPSAQSESIWENLVNEDLAQRSQTKNQGKYVFLSK